MSSGGVGSDGVGSDGVGSGRPGSGGVGSGGLEELFETEARGTDARRHLAKAGRRIAELSVSAVVGDVALAEAAEQLNEICDHLEESAGPGRFPRTMPDPSMLAQDVFPTSPVIGWLNPLAPPLEIWTEDNKDGQREVKGRVTFGYAYEGPPTCVHGGVIAELFDELLGTTNIMTGTPGMTGTLTVRYLRPTPLKRQLDVHSRVVGREGRKIRTWGGITYDSELTAEAEGVFIAVPPDQMMKIAARNMDAVTGRSNKAGG